jgi:hypothetical protein
MEFRSEETVDASEYVFRADDELRWIVKYLLVIEIGTAKRETERKRTIVLPTSEAPVPPVTTARARSTCIRQARSEAFGQTIEFTLRGSKSARKTRDKNVFDQLLGEAYARFCFAPDKMKRDGRHWHWNAHTFGKLFRSSYSLRSGASFRDIAGRRAETLTCCNNNSFAPKFLSYATFFSSSDRKKKHFFRLSIHELNSWFKCGIMVEAGEDFAFNWSMWLAETFKSAKGIC